MKRCEDSVSAKEIFDSFLEGGIDDSKKDRHMLFGKKFKSSPSTKSFVRVIRSLVSSEWLSKMEEEEAEGTIQWTATHILSVDLLPTETVVHLLEKNSADGLPKGTANPFYEH